MRYLENVKVLNELANDAYAASQTGTVASFPQNVSIVTTFRCNYRCRMCFQPVFTGELDWRIMENIEPILPFVREFHPFGGEPLLYKRIDDFFDLGSRYGCRLKLITNGSLITPEVAESMVANRVHRLLVSTDAGSPESYAFIRGGSYERLMDNLEELARRKQAHASPYPLLELNFLAMRRNVGELPALVERAAGLGATSINVFYPKILTAELVPECLYFHQDYADACLIAAVARGRELGVRVVIPRLFDPAREPQATESRARQKCTRPWRNLNIDLAGEVTLCCFGSPSAGNILRDDFDTIWNSPLARRLRETVGTSEEMECCRTCQVTPFSPRHLEYHMAPALARHASGSRGAAPDPAGGDHPPRTP